MTSSLTLSILVCAYTEERWHDLIAAIESLRNQTVPLSEIIVVVDHNERLLERVRAEFPEIVCIENSQAPGLSGARNSGIAIAKGEILAFMDEDAEATPTWAANLLAVYSTPQVLGAGGAILPQWLSGKPAWFPEEFGWVVGCTYRGMPLSTATVRNLIGCNMSFRREMFDVIGGFRNGLGRIGTRPVGCEETELCIRALQRWEEGYFLYVPDAQVCHQVPSSRTTWHYFCSRCYLEGVSKAQVTQFVGSTDGLASERAYTLKTLPWGVARGIADTLFGLRPAGLARAAAIVAGLALTTAGYLRGRLGERIAVFHRTKPYLESGV